MKYKLRRHGFHCITADGLFTVWNENRSGHEFRWYVNHRSFDETLMLGGFPTKGEAVKWLKQQYEERPDYLFSDFPSDRNSQ